MSHRTLLHIYDGYDVVNSARHLFDQSFEPLKGADVDIPVIPPYTLTQALDAVLATKQTFSNLVITSHGSAGQIKIGGKPVARNTRTFYGRHSDIFPTGGTIYLRGCNCGEGDAGLEFMQHIGEKLLINAGGHVIAHTGKGVYFDTKLAGILSFAAGPMVFEHLRGHSIHFGYKRIAVFTPGGRYHSWYED